MVDGVSAMSAVEVKVGFGRLQVPEICLTLLEKSVKNSKLEKSVKSSKLTDRGAGGGGDMDLPL